MCDQDVRQSMDRVRTSPFLLHTDDVRGFVFDVHSGLAAGNHAQLATDATSSTRP